MTHPQESELREEMVSILRHEPNETIVQTLLALTTSYAASQRQEGERQGALNALVQLKADRINHTLTRPADEWETWMQFIDKRIEKYNVPQDTEVTAVREGEEE